MLINDKNEKTNYCVYVHVNKINKKLYIGITCNLKQRWSDNGNRYRGSIAFFNAIKKYGWDNFDHIVLIENITKTMAEEIEIALIKKYNTRDHNFGYNLARGGGGGCNTNSGKKSPKAVPIYQYDLDGNFIQKFDSIADAKRATGIQAISAYARKNKSRIMTDYQWRYEYTEKIPPIHKYDPHVDNRQKTGKIIQIDTDGNLINIYDDLWDISDDQDVIGLIRQSYSIHKPVLYKDHYWIPENQFTLEYLKKTVFYFNKKHKHIDQYDLDGNFIKTWRYESEITKTLNLHTSRIRYCCEGKAKTSCGFLWKYTENVQSIIMSNLIDTANKAGLSINNIFDTNEDWG